MSTEKKVLVAVLIGVLLVVVFVLSSPVVEKEISPKPRAAWVAIEVGDRGVARTGPVRVDGDTSFRLHAVLEAETFSGDTIYYTEYASDREQRARINLARLAKRPPLRLVK